MKCSLLTLSGYLDGELDPGRRAEVDAHLVGCDRCRRGLDCLVEETDRFAALGRLHVPDGAIHDFLEQLGLIGPDETLPPRSPRSPGAVNRDVPPWMGGGGAGAALPWMARRDADPAGGSQPTLPFTDSISPGVMPPPPPPPPPPRVAERELNLNGRSTAVPSPSPPTARPVAVTVAPPLSLTAGPLPAIRVASPPAPTPALSHPPDTPPGNASPTAVGSVTLDGVSTWPRRILSSASVGAEPAAGTGELSVAADAAPPSHESSDANDGKPAQGPRLILPTTPLPLLPPDVPPAPFPASPLPRQPYTPRAPISPSPALPSAGAMWPARSAKVPSPAVSDDEEDPWSWAPREEGSAPTAAESVRPSGSPSTPAGVSAPPLAGMAHGGAVNEISPGSAGSPDPDTTPDPLIDPLIARVARPPQMVHATLISRLRDQVALRLALMRGTGADETAGSAPPRAPSGERSEPVESVGPAVSATRPRAESGGPQGGRTGTAPWGPPPPERVEPRHWADMPLRTPTSAEELPWSMAPPRGHGLPRTPGRHTRRLGGRRAALGAAGGSVAQMAQRFGELPSHVRRLAAHPRRRWLAVAILAVFVVVGSLVIARLTSGSGGTHPGAVAATLPRASASTAPLTRPTASPQASASTAPTATPAPSVTATPAPTPVPTPIPPTQLFGGGGSGWALQDVRYGTQPDGELWIVVDFNGGSGQPTAAAAFSNPTTLLVTLTGVSPSSLTPGTGGIVTGATVTTSGTHVILHFDLSKAAALKGGYYSAGADSESSAPLHLVLELG